MEQSEQSSAPSLCINCNQFYSTVACNDLCSKCHREKTAAEAKTAAAGAAVEALVQASRPTTAAPAAAAAAAAAAPEEVATTSAPAAAPGGEAPGGPKDGMPTRCTSCRKKVGLCGFRCKCGHLFCGQHRYPESHACSYDYKGTGRAALAEANPVVQASKVQKL